MRVPVPQHIDPAASLGRVHFVGIGGAALSGLARIMVERGLTVTGSDAHSSTVLDSLRAVGITCWVGHDASQVDQADTVVVSTAIRADNPEVARAREMGLRVWPRSAAVQSLLLGRTAIVVTGTHGKTTTTAMLTTALQACGADPSYAIGSALAASGVNAADGSGSIFVVEGDESDAAILTYTPVGAVITNVDADHLDQYGTVAAYRDVFDAFLDRIQPDGFCVCCVDDPGAAHVADEARRRKITAVTVGQGPQAMYRVADATFPGHTSTFEMWHGQDRLGTVSLVVPGLTSVLDAAAALVTGLHLGFAFDDLAAGLAEYAGSNRRMERKGSAGGVRVYDSYAHHPTEISADLQAARAVAGSGRLIVCYQPHLYSRTRIFGAEMGAALGSADEVVVMDVYAAREEPDPTVSGALVADAVPLGAEMVQYVA
ncbi:MAG: UDP-N-acetylmuramate--L-alanine ligase, partial [Nocardioidaceae bacterium]